MCATTLTYMEHTHTHTQIAAIVSAVSLEPPHCHSLAPWTLCGLLQPHCSPLQSCPPACTAVPRQHAPSKQMTYGVFCSQHCWASWQCFTVTLSSGNPGFPRHWGPCPREIPASLGIGDPVLWGKSLLPSALVDVSPSCSSATAQCPRQLQFREANLTSESYFRLPWAPGTQMACRHSGKTHNTHKIKIKTHILYRSLI